MTLDEAQIIARIVSTADGGCSTCIRDLAGRLNAADLGFKFEQVSGEQWSEPNPYDEAWPFNWPLVRVTVT